MLLKFLSILNLHQKKEILFFLIASIILVIADLCSALSLSLLVSYLTTNNLFILEKFPQIKSILFSSEKNIIYTLLIYVGICFYSANILRAWYNYKKIKFINNIRIFITTKIYKKFFSIPYKNFIKYTQAQIETSFNFQSERFSGSVMSFIKMNEGIVSLVVLIVSVSLVNIKFLIYLIIITFIFFFYI